MTIKMENIKKNKNIAVRFLKIILLDKNVITVLQWYLRFLVAKEKLGNKLKCLHL